MRVGQGLLLSLNFADGGQCTAKRTFLVIKVLDKEIHLLNISSIQGKEHKLAFPSNEKICKYRPPFMKKSFCKLDALYIIPNESIINSYVLADGRAMHPDEISRIIQAYSNYREENQIGIANITLEEVLAKNDICHAKAN